MDYGELHTHLSPLGFERNFRPSLSRARPPFIHHQKPGHEVFCPDVTRPQNEKNVAWCGGRNHMAPSMVQSCILEVRLAFLFDVILEHLSLTCMVKPGGRLKTDSNSKMAVVLEMSRPE